MLTPQPCVLTVHLIEGHFKKSHRFDGLKQEFDKDYEKPESMGGIALSVLCTFAYRSCKNVPTTFSTSISPSAGNNSKSAT